MADFDSLSRPDCGTGYEPASDVPHTSYNSTRSTLLLEAGTSPTKQQRLLQGRNARFLAKKLSISSLNSKLSGLVHSTEELETHPSRDQENIIHKSKSAGTLGQKLSSSRSLSVLGEISNSTRYRSFRTKNASTDRQDNLERPLLDRSPFSSPQPCNISSSENVSPVNFDHINDSLTGMRSRENLAYRRSSSTYHTPPHTFKQVKSRRSAPLRFNFDAEEYIEHIERELEQVKEDAYCPETKRPLKEKLKIAITENERLQEELSFLRERFETEVKRTLEHNTSVEADLRRKVRDLEEKLEAKEQVLKEVQYQHEEKRLDNSIIETLKATIERLEQEKQTVETENVNVTKRNDVLTQLLAMSPTKIQTADPSSPVREKRNCRPLSMIFPRAPTSPEIRNASCGASTANSPETEILDYFSTLASTLSVESEARSKQSQLSNGLGIENVASPREISPNSEFDSCARRWTFHPGMAAVPTNTGGVPLSPSEENKHISKRRPRKFLRGSTQLKPLLLPALTESGLPSASSTMSSPSNARTRSPSELSMETSASIIHHPETISDLFEASVSELDPVLSFGPGPACDSDEVVSTLAEADEIFMPGFSAAIESTSSSQMKKEHHDQHSFNKQLRNSFNLQPRHAQALASHTISSSRSQLCALTADFEPQRELPAHSTLNTAVPQPLFSPRCFNTASQANVQEFSQNGLGLGRSPDASFSRRRRQSDASMNGVLDSPTTKISHRRPLSFSLCLLPPMPSASTSSCASTGCKDKQRCKSRPVSTQYGNLPIKSPLDILKQKDFRARTLASLGIRTIYGLLATCTSVIRQAKQNPFALAKRVLANAWRANWAAMGKASWWVLGLFVDVGQKARRRNSFSWDEFDGESIAHRICDSPRVDDDVASSYRDSVSVPHQHPDWNSSVVVLRSPKEPNQQDHVGWSGSLFLWGKFSVAIMLAVGGAVVKGPAEALRKLDPDKERLQEPGSQGHQRFNSQHKLVETFKGSEHIPDMEYRFKERNQNSSVDPWRFSENTKVSRPVPPGLVTRTSSYDPQTLMFDGGDETQRTLRPSQAPRPLARDIFTDISPLSSRKANNAEKWLRKGFANQDDIASASTTGIQQRLDLDVSDLSDAQI